MTSTKNQRLIACNILQKVIYQQKSLTPLLAADPNVTPYIKVLCYGVLRSYFCLNALLNLLLKKPLKKKDADIHCLILIGLYELDKTETPDYAVIKECVNATTSLKKIWAKALVNALLRQFQRDKLALLTQANQSTEAQYNHPNWLIEKIKADWPENYNAILQANNQQAPLILRINKQQTSRDEYLKLLQKSDIKAQACELSSSAVILEEAMPVANIPGFEKGTVSVQDSAAQLAAMLLELAPNQTLLDACAAPGGKTAHILETEPKVSSLLALDIDQERCQKIEENLQRLQLSATIQCGDANDLASSQQPASFDRILLDAPCSGTGVIRRHPDIKLLRRPQDIASFTEQQLTLLNSLWPLLKQNGLLLYATCSILPQENSRLISRFLEQQHSASEVRIDQAWGIKQTHGRQLFPQIKGNDGFFYALLRKV